MTSTKESTRVKAESSTENGNSKKQACADSKKKSAGVKKSTSDNTKHGAEKTGSAVKHRHPLPLDTITAELVKEEWHPIQHPRLPITTPPRYFVNKGGVVCSNATGKLKPMRPMKETIPRYEVYVDKKKRLGLKLDEIMAATFSGQQFDKNKHYIYHKDGQQGNCAWDNLIVCDLATLQDMEIARLEKAHSGTKYTVVRNVHDNLTFERYLVSNTGNIYSLITRKLLCSSKGTNGYQRVDLQSDFDSAKAISKRVNILVHSIVIQSFKGRRVDNLEIDHFSGKKSDNSLENLAFVTRSENQYRRYGPIQTEARNMLREQGEVPKKITARPLPPVTEETKWKPVGILPWNGRTFSNYEVSDMGHVRKIGKSKLLTLSWASGGYYSVHMCPDKQQLNGDYLTTASIRQVLVLVSRLVANAFVDGYSETRSVVRHLNGDRQDNRAQNLEWISKDCSSMQKNSRRVAAALADDPKAQKDFLSSAKAERELNKRIGSVKYGESVKKEVDWDGEKRMAIIQVF